MPDSIIEQLICSHQTTLEHCRALLSVGLSGSGLTPQMIKAIEDENGCEFSKILQSGRICFDGAMAGEVVPVLHSTFHSLAALILTLVVARVESREIGTYMAALNGVSSQMVAVLRQSRVHSE